MKKIKIIIERSKDGYFWGYAESDRLSITGGGETVQACKDDILACIEVLKEIDQFPYGDGEYELVYKYDMESLLNYYKKIFTLASLERITGVDQKYLQHYSTGLKKPRQERRKKIEASLHKLGSELMALEL